LFRDEQMTLVSRHARSMLEWSADGVAWARAFDYVIEGHLPVGKDPARCRLSEECPVEWVTLSARGLDATCGVLFSTLALLG
jgi:hypothetical protein